MLGIVCENTASGTELLNYPVSFVPGSAHCSSALCLFSFFLHITVLAYKPFVYFRSRLVSFMLNVCMCQSDAPGGDTGRTLFGLTA